jgi:putative methyltransferase (TIGR04325 family)
MKPKIYSILKQVLPPFVVAGVKKVRQKMKGRPTDSSVANVWQGGYPDWQSACAAAEGYDTQAIFEKVRDASRMVRDGKAVYERDSVLFNKIEYSWPLLASLLWIAARHEGALRLIDFGGSLGSSYRQNRHFLAGLKKVRWNVVEQGHFVRSGKEEFQTEELRFYETIAACLADGEADGILLSSVLQYLNEPYAFMEEVCLYEFEYIILDRTPFSAAEERITVQHVPESIYKASYPCRFLDKKRLEAIIWQQYDIIEWFDTLGGPEWLGCMAQRRQG